MQRFHPRRGFGKSQANVGALWRGNRHLDTSGQAWHQSITAIDCWAHCRFSLNSTPNPL